jgi:hypothetical protein
MPSASNTAYPCLKINPSTKELNELYSPTVYGPAFARERARQPMQRAGLFAVIENLSALRLFCRCAEIPIPIVRHVFRCAGFTDSPEQGEPATEPSRTPRALFSSESGAKRTIFRFVR